MRIVRLVLVGALLVGCSTAAEIPSPSGSGEPASFSPSAAASPMPPSESPPASSASSASPASPSAGAGPGDAARWLLAQGSARFEHEVDRLRPNLPDERQAASSGVVDPRGDRGSMSYEWFPDAPADDPFRIAVDVAWSPDDLWVRGVPDEDDEVWRHVPRRDAPRMALVGRIHEEPLALVRFAAEADPGEFEPLPATAYRGAGAARWLLRVPVETTEAAYVPPDSYLGFETIFGLDALPLEVWLIDGIIVRTGYVLEREEAPYGGPDHFETWYDWTAIGEPVELEVPPEGEITDLPD